MINLNLFADLFLAASKHTSSWLWNV